jgi:hypothetical protein
MIGENNNQQRLVENISLVRANAGERLVVGQGLSVGRLARHPLIPKSFQQDQQVHCDASIGA